MAVSLLQVRDSDSNVNFREIETALTKQQESFASPTAPTSPRIGQVWFDTTANEFKYYNNSYAAVSLTSGSGTVTSLTEGTGINLTPDTITSTGSIAVNFSAVQAKDATLDALAAYNTNGLLTQTAADTFTGRTLTGTSNRISVSNGNGVSGNPTVDIDSAYVGQSSITTLGTISTGVWEGTAIADASLAESYLIRAGRSGGQTAIGGTAASNNLGLQSTSHGTKGYVLGTSGDLWGVGGVTTPVSGNFATFSDVAAPTRTGTTKGITVAAATDAGYTAKNTATGAELYFGGFFTGGVAIGSISNTQLAFITNSTEKITIDTSGNVGILNTAPKSNIDLQGSMSYKRTADSTTSYTATATDYYIGMTNTGSRTVNLPTAVGIAGRVYIIADEAGTASTAPITIDPNGAQTIGGAATFNVDRNLGAATIISDNANWRIISAPGTFGGGTVTSITAGTGLSGGTITASGTIAIDTATTVDKTTAQTLTNKTLTSPIISSISNTGTLTLPTSTDTLVGRATTDTLTNKTIDGDSNKIVDPCVQIDSAFSAQGANFTTTSATYVDITGMSFTYTPSADNERLYLWVGAAFGNSGSNNTFVTVSIAGSDQSTALFRNIAGTGPWQERMFIYDIAGGAGATTIKLRCKTASGTATVITNTAEIIPHVKGFAVKRS